MYLIYIPCYIAATSLIKFCLACICNRQIGEHLGYMSSHKVHRRAIFMGFKLKESCTGIGELDGFCSNQ